jgi:hypothetical protein
MKRRAWYAVFVLPFAALLFPGLYNRPDPALFGLPFFYWYQLLWVIITSALLGIVYLATRQADDV